jgi:hypothetical protein
MIITQTRTMRNNVFRMEVSTELDTIDSKYIEQYGEPRIDTLGTIPMGVDTFILAGGPNYVFVRSNMPIYYEVNANVDADAMAKVDAWGAEMAVRLAAVMEDLKEQVLPTSPNVTYTQA